MKVIKFRLTQIVMDMQTGFTGRVIGVAQYLYGENQYLVTQDGLDPSGRVVEEWFTESRIESKE